MSISEYVDGYFHHMDILFYISYLSEWNTLERNNFTNLNSNFGQLESETHKIWGFRGRLM